MLSYIIIYDVSLAILPRPTYDQANVQVENAEFLDDEAPVWVPDNFSPVCMCCAARLCCWDI